MLNNEMNNETNNERKKNTCRQILSQKEN